MPSGTSPGNPLPTHFDVTVTDVGQHGWAVQWLPFALPAPPASRSPPRPNGHEHTPIPGLNPARKAWRGDCRRNPLFRGLRKKIFNVHFRNDIEGGFLNFRETFIDNGSVDMLKAMRVYRKWATTA